MASDKPTIIHFVLSAPYNDNWGYQDNLLPKFQCPMAKKVYVVTTCMKNSEDGHIVHTEEASYVLNDGVRVIRLKHIGYRFPSLRRVFCFLNMYHLKEILDEIKPNIIFFHGMVSSSIIAVAAYKRTHPECWLVQDNHLDWNIGPQHKGIKKIFLRGYYRLLHHITKRYVDKVYAVTPWRVQYAVDYYKVDKRKIDLLIMGADDDKLRFEKKQKYRDLLRKKVGVNSTQKVLVTGGKIDASKGIGMLLEAVRSMSRVHLVVFGKPVPEYRDEFFTLLNDKTTYVGWIASDEVYEYFMGADMAVFPGQHSVLWEQACACKIPCVFREWPGMDYLNNGGNSDLFTNPVSAESIQVKLNSIFETDQFSRMLEVAESSKTDVYKYSSIAKKTLADYEAGTKDK
jgi:1,2-diacylglycerol 3-alpha-glucosyltransferase